MARIVLQGVRELERRLRAVGDERRMQAAVNRGLREVYPDYQRAYRRRLREAAPVRTGRLRRSIRVRRGRGFVLYPQMKFYGFITNAVPPHRGWASEARDATVADPDLRRALAQAVVRQVKRAIARALAHG